jgi:hypothetical protein
LPSGQTRLKHAHSLTLFINHIIEREGDTLEGARANLIEVLTLLFETADPSEVGQRLRSELFVTQVEVPVG